MVLFIPTKRSLLNLNETILSLFRGSGFVYFIIIAKINLNEETLSSCQPINCQTTIDNGQYVTPRKRGLYYQLEI